MRGVAGLHDAAAFLLRVVLPRALRVRRLAVAATAAAATVLSFAETAAAAFSRLAASTAAAVAGLRVRVLIPAVFSLMAELLAGSPVAILILVGSDGPQGMALPDVSVTLPDVSNF